MGSHISSSYIPSAITITELHTTQTIQVTYPATYNSKPLSSPPHHYIPLKPSLNCHHDPTSTSLSFLLHIYNHPNLLLHIYIYKTTSLQKLPMNPSNQRLRVLHTAAGTGEEDAPHVWEGAWILQ